MSTPSGDRHGSGTEVLEGWLVDPDSIPEAPSAPELLAAVLDNSPDPVLVFSAKAQPVLANAMARRFWPGGKLTKSLPKTLLANVRRVHETAQPYHRRRLEEMVAVSLQSLVRESLDNLDREVSRLDLTVSTNFHSEDLPIPLDRETARLVIHQMLSAAIRDADPMKEIRIILESNAGKARLEVEPCPNGASSALPSDLFAFPLESDDIRNMGATALGLRFAHELVHTEGGSIHFRELSPCSALVFEFPLPGNIPDD